MCGQVCGSCSEVKGLQEKTFRFNFSKQFLPGLYRNSSLTMLDLSMNRLDSSGALILEDWAVFLGIPLYSSSN